MSVELADLLRYDGWANRRVLESFQQPQTPPRALELFAHILGAQETWLSRLGGLDSSAVEVWPALTLAECEPRQRRMEHALAGLVRMLGEEKLDQPIEYVTTAGKAFQNTPRQILTHVVFHGQHHRGQIASCMREAGLTPAATDLIAHFRES
ncbi:MAG: DinB family protein [Bryobacterales bacterium]